MAITWEEARDKIRVDLWRPGSSGVPDDVCDRAIHAACLDLEARRSWLWLENIKQSAELAAAASEIAAPADMARIQAISFRRSETEQDAPLARVTLAEVRTLAAGTTGTWPSSYAVNDGDIFFDCEAPIGSSFEMVYQARTAEDVDVAKLATNTTLNKHQTAIIAYACGHVAQTFLKNEAEAARQMGAYERIASRLEDAEDAARGDEHGGCVQPDRIYHVAAYGQ